MSVKRATIVAGPVVGVNAKGRRHWSWLVVQTVGDRKDERTVATRREALSILNSAILAGIRDGYEMHARFVDQSGGGDQSVYHPDGSISHTKKISPKDGMLGPRCFQLPITAEARAKRASLVRRMPPKPKRAAKPKRVAKPKTEKPKRVAKPKTEKPKRVAKPKTEKPKRVAKPKTEKPKRVVTPKRKRAAPKPAPKKVRLKGRKMAVPRKHKPSPQVADYLVSATTVSTARAWLQSHAPVYRAHVGQYLKKYGTARQKQILGKARMPESKPTPPAPPVEQRKPRRGGGRKSSTSGRRRTAAPPATPPEDPNAQAIRDLLGGVIKELKEA